MTAPLPTSKNIKKSTPTLQNMEGKLQKAINNHDLNTTDKIISKMLDMHISQAYLKTLYGYADKKHEKEICQYIKQILFINNNTCNIA